MNSSSLDMRIIVAGIGTDIGKTVASAVIAKTLQADYWKPISCGADDDSDRHTIEQMGIRTYPESYQLPYPVSPHEAARKAGIELDANQVILPKADRLIIEMAGGVTVPFDDHSLTIDLFQKWQADWVLIASNYLGSINHTLLTIEALRKRNIKPLGLIFNGKPNRESERFILDYSALPCIGRIERHDRISSETITGYSTRWRHNTPWNRLRA